MSTTLDWPLAIHAVLQQADVGVVGYVPDAGHKRLIELCHADPAMRTVILSTEEEGIGIAAGAWLGGARSVWLMQSSGVGNCVNALATVKECRFPLVMLITMRGDHGEFNPWQVPMGQATATVLETMGVVVYRATRADDVASSVDAALRIAYGSYCAAAVLIGQNVIGIKSFQEQAAK